MTAGEKMVWAAVFARKFDISDPPGEVLQADRGGSNPDSPWAAWEADQVVEAVEAAGHAVEHLRESRVRVVEAFGGASSTFELLREMLA